MPDCSFCKIVTKDVFVHVIYEDEYSIAFMDRHPINPGHILVIPKVHQPEFYKLDEQMYTQIMLVVKNLSNKIQNKFNPKKVGVIIAGFDVPHTHIHIIPMVDYNDITSKSIIEGNRANPTEDELETSAMKLRENMPN